MNEKGYTIIVIGVLILAMLVTGFCLGYSVPDRGQSPDVTAVQRRTEEQQRQYEGTIEQLRNEVRCLRDNSREAERIVDSMGVQLERNDGTIQSTVELIKTLRNQIQDLMDIYTDSDSHYSGLDSLDNE